jgi:hypothetical protein
MSNLFDILSPDGSPIYLANLPNKKGPGQRTYHQYVHNEAELQKFIATYDKPGRALYHTVARLKAGTTRCKENVEAVHWAFVEIDFKDHPDIAPEEIRRRVEAMPLPATLIITSGHGLHLYWKFNEALDATPGRAQEYFEDALKLACAYVGGDSSATEAARLLRLPGSHNTKFGDSILVSIVANTGHSYELSDLVDFWTEAQPIMPEPVKPDAPGTGTNNFNESSGPVDVEARLQNMQWQGPGAARFTRRNCSVLRRCCAQGCPSKWPWPRYWQRRARPLPAMRTQPIGIGRRSNSASRRCHTASSTKTILWSTACPMHYG